jgi:hypothetical protein
MALGTAHAATVTFVVQAAGANQVPVVSSGGAANAQFYFDDETNELTYSVGITGVSSDEVTGAQIQRGAAGEAGPVAYTLADEGFTQITGSLDLSADDVDALMAGGLYLNVLSVDFPEGFARGQLLPEATISNEADESMTGSQSADEASDDATADEADEAAAEEDVSAAADVSPPNTGDAGLADSRGTNLMPAVILLTLLGAGTAALVIRSRV